MTTQEKLDFLIENKVNIKYDDKGLITFASSIGGEHFISFSDRVPEHRRVEICYEYFTTHNRLKRGGQCN